MPNKIKLNIGCGTRLKDGYINIDLRKTHPLVMIGDVRNLPFKNNSVDEILANDVYEHIKFSDSLILLTHWVSKLKVNGSLIMQMPNILGLADLIKKQTTIEGIEKIIRKIFGGQDHKFNYHYTSGHPLLIEHYLRKAGIQGDIAITSKGSNMKIIAFK